jgi:hypothetical protein
LIETPLDTLNICRGIFVKSLVEDIGVFESASEYLEAYDSVNKLDLYYDKPYNEQALFRLAKAALEDSINTGGYTDDTMGYQDTGTPVQQPVQPQEEGQQPSVLQDTKSDLYRGDIIFRNFDNAPSKNEETGQWNNKFATDSTFNPLLEKRYITVGGKSYHLPLYQAKVISNHQVDKDDEFHNGRTPAEYDAHRQGKYIDVKSNSSLFKNPKALGKLNIGDHQHHKLTDMASEHKASVEDILSALAEHWQSNPDNFTLRDYFMGLEFHNPEQRTDVYNHIYEHGTDNRDKQSINNHHSIPRVKWDLWTRLKPFTDALMREEGYTSENIRALAENQVDPRAKPTHITDALSEVELDLLTNSLFSNHGIDDKERIKFDYPKYSPTKRSFSLDRRKLSAHGDRFVLDPRDETRLNASGFAMAVGWDEKNNRFYEDGQHPIFGEKWRQSDAPFTSSEINNMMRRFDNSGKSIRYGSEMKNHAMSIFNRLNHLPDQRLHIHSDSPTDHSQDYMGGDERGFNHHWADMTQGIGGHNLQLNNAMRAVSTIFDYQPENRENIMERKGMGKVGEKDNLLFDTTELDDPAYKRTGAHIISPDESSQGAICFMGQPQVMHRVLPIYNKDEEANYHVRALSDPDTPKPKPTGHYMAPLAQMRRRLYTRRLGEASGSEEHDILPTKTIGAMLSQYEVGQIGPALQGSRKGVGFAHSRSPNSSNQAAELLRGGFGEREINHPTSPRRRASRVLNGERVNQSIKDTFSRPSSIRRKIYHRDTSEGQVLSEVAVTPDVKQRRRQNKKQHSLHAVTGSAYDPRNPQESNILLEHEDGFKPANSTIHDILSRASNDERIETYRDPEEHEKNIESTENTIKDLENDIKEINQLPLTQSVLQFNRKKKLLEQVENLQNELKNHRTKLNRSRSSKVPRKNSREIMESIESMMDQDFDNEIMGGTDNTHRDDLQQEINARNEPFGPDIQRTQQGHKAVGMGMDAVAEYTRDLISDLQSGKIPYYDESGQIIPFTMGDTPDEELDNMYRLINVGERGLHRHPKDGKQYFTMAESYGPQEIPIGEDLHKIKDIILANGSHGSVPPLDEHGRITNEIRDNLNSIIDDWAPESPHHYPNHMYVKDILTHLYPELKDDLIEQSKGDPHSVHAIANNFARRLGLGLDSLVGNDKSNAIAGTIGLHFLAAKNTHSTHKGDHSNTPRDNNGKDSDEKSDFGHRTRQILNSTVVANPLHQSTDKQSATIHDFSINNRTPISDITKPDSETGVTALFHSLGHGAHSHTFHNTTMEPMYDVNHNLIGIKKVEPYDFKSKTASKAMYNMIYPSIVGKLNAVSGRAQPEIFGRGLEMKHDTADATLLLASLSNPDIMLKADGDYPILQPMHRIFKLEDLEHLRGFSGDWIVSAMPQGQRCFIEKKKDEVTSKDDKKLDDKTKESFSKISKQNYVVDVVYDNEEYHVIDIVEYDDKDIFDIPLQERIKILRGTMESTENVLVPSAHSLRLTDDVGLEAIIKDLRKEHDRLILRDANSTYMKGESRHPKWVLFDEGQDVNLMVLDRKGTSSYTYRLGTGPITHEDSLGDRAVEYEGDTYMDIGTSFQTKDKYEIGDIVTVNVDNITVTENIDGADIYTVSSNDIVGEAEGEGVSSVETLSMFTKCEPTLWPHEVNRIGDRIVIKMAAGEVSYRASSIDGDWYMFNPKAENNWLIRLAESQRPFWSPIAGVMLKADLQVMDDEEAKAEVKESKGDAKPLISPKEIEGTDFWNDYNNDKAKIRRLLAKSLNLVNSMLKSSVGAVGDSSTGAMGLGIGYATPIESPTGPTNLNDPKTMPDYDTRKREGEETDVKDSKHSKPVRGQDDEDIAGHLSIDKDKAAFVSY